MTQTTTLTPPARKTLPWLLIERFTAYKQVAGAVIALVLFIAALFICWKLVKETNIAQMRQAVHDVPWSALLLALLAAAGSYTMLIGYEWSASHYAGVQLRPGILVTGGFCAAAVGNAVGLSMLSGGAVRCRLYFSQGLNATDVARMSIFASLSLGCALPLLAAIAALCNVQAAALALHLSAAWVTGIAWGVFALYLIIAMVLYQHRLRSSPPDDTPGTGKSRWFQYVQFGRWPIRIPSLRLASWQLVITLFDVIFAATILYLLLPSAPPFITFVLVYLLALAAGVLSHVPGGLGVFEAVILAAFAGQLGAAQLAAALLLYRAVYVLLPLGLASIILLLNEGRNYLPLQSVMRSAASVAAPIISVLVFAAGIILLFSGATPEIDSRLQILSFIMPDQLINASHLAASLVGVLCLVLARGLRRRLSAAWMLTLLLLIAASVLSILKGLDWEEAFVMLVIAALLYAFRSSFYRKSRLTEVPFSALFATACFCVVAVSLWLTFFVYQEIPYHNKLWWQFELDSEAPRALRAALASFLLLGCIALTWLLRPALPIARQARNEQLDEAYRIVQAGTQPEGGLVMSGDKAILFNETRTAFLMYARHRRSMIALFDPIGSALERADLIWEFRDLCDQHRVRPVFYQVSAANLPYYMDAGLTAIKLGEEAIVDLTRFDLQSKTNRDLRYTWSRGQRDGLSLAFYAPGTAPMAQLQEISDQWLQNKHVREKGFSLGHFAPDYLRHFTIATVEYQGQIVAFANLLQTTNGASASLDLMRVADHAPNLTMEFLMVGLILHFQQHQLQRFSLGMVPLSGLHLRRGAPVTQRLGAMIFRRGEQFYNFQGLRRFKNKFSPHWEPRYMAVPAGLDPWMALVDTATLISGGWSGLVKR
ncbi:Phosphatidylglycerol lysyltransferase [Saezia sanguinis]|uniref:Phosphatidylglycerol lysyltransferase n=1 Tax=Saezia sanguinis TaxID=1965230 RepID=A0A433SCQ8_9BURK|nr:bifunctional lysylphosphatidylglycerol flippase/synthetase MprF [Saezia sanguinis]RUS66466.1 Phosphatidylglycerol lysyltransferase [Saezia sanguinis]